MKQFKIYAVLFALLVFGFALFWRPTPPPKPNPAAAPSPTLAQPAAPALLSKSHPATLVSAPPPATNAAPIKVAATPEPTAQLLPVLKEFNNWANQFTNGGTASLAEGERLARTRRTVMAHLIKTAPQKALEWTVPAGWRTKLPASVTQYFEQRVDARGSFNVAIATDFNQNTSKTLRDVQVDGKRFDAFVYGRREKEVSQASIPIHGIALDGKLAVHEDPLRILEPEEVVSAEASGIITREEICGVSGRPSNYRKQEVTADIGGQVIRLCGVDHARLVNQRLTAAEGSTGTIPGGTGAGVVGWTQGPKSVLYMRVNFPDDLSEPISETSAYGIMDDVNAFYVEGSYNTTTLTPTVTPLLTLPQSKAWYSTAGAGSLQNDARNIARAAGYDTANYDLDIVTFTSVPGYDFGGLAYVGGKGVWLQSPGVGVTSHELGHNYGLWHANFWDTSTTNYDSIIGPGAHVEYGNVYDTMGRASAGNNQFNAMHKNILDWLPDLYVHDIKSNGVYRVYAFDVPGRVEGQFYSAKIRKDFQRDYWIEFRQKFKSNPWLQNGLLVNWSPWAESSGGTHLLDTTPGTPTDDDSKEDAAVVIGRTYTDAPAGIHITPLTRGQTGTNPWIDVQVNLGSFPSNEPPVLTIEMDATNAVPGELVHFHATASDPNGDTLAYAWSFDDLKFSSNNLAWTSQSWDAPGEHVVRCVVSDMKGGIASANTVVTIGAPLGYRVSGLIIDTNGVPIEGVRVDTTLTNGTYFGGYTDSDGRYVIVDATQDLTLYAFKYGYTFTNITWINPITAGTNNIDFIATPVQAVSIATTTNAIPENDGSLQYFTLTRTGDLSTNLLVNLYLSGSATLDSDYTLIETLYGTNVVEGTNVVDIPPGSNQVQFAFHAINNGTFEGAETVTFSILEDTNYVNASLSETTITILDDDNTPLPRVSVGAIASSGGDTVIESALNGGVFTFTRTGSTQNDLTINYAVSGSATSGVDYQTLLGVLIIPAGSSTASVNLRTIDDTLVESNETVRVTISANAAYTVSGNPATITIVNDDFTTVTVYPTGNAAEPSSSGRFTVMRVGDINDNLVVNYTVGGTATSSADYTPLSGTVTIPGGKTSADITLTPLSDNLLEGDESVLVTLASNTNYSVGTPGNATVFIRDAQRPTLSISVEDSIASEPDIDPGQFVISRGSVVNGDLTVNLAISGSAVNGADYVPIDNFIVIPDGSSSVTIDVIPFDDLHFETNESVIVTFVPSTNYNFSSQQSGQVTILDDDLYSVPAVGFSFAASSAPESRSPGVSVTLSATSAVPVTVNYIRIGGTAPSSRYDFEPGTLTINPGEQAVPIPLSIIDNTTVEPNQTIRFALVDPSNATLDAIKVHTYTILDDDASKISVTATVPAASETGPIPGNFRFSRVGGTNAQIVNFQVTGTASAPTDYAPIGNSVTIPAGATFVDVPVVPANEASVELAETVVVTLTSAPGASLATPQVAIVTITDNDTNTLPIVSISSTNKPYAVEATANNGEFVFTRTGSTATALPVSFTVTGKAANGVDYTTLPNVITIPAGQTSFTLPVVPLTDNLVEGEETVIVTLTDNSTYQVRYPSSATVIVQDHDQSVSLEATDFAASKTGPDLGEFTFVRVGTTNTDLKVFYAISGTASNGVDYLAITNFFVIPAGQFTNTLPIIPHSDFVPKGPVTLTLTLLSDPAYTISSPAGGTVVIDDNMPMLELVGTATNASENAEQPGIITIKRRGDPEIDFTAFVTIGGTATYGVDYPAFQTNVFFCCGVTSIDLTISPTNELFIEGTETVTATLQPNPATYTIIGASNVEVTIDDVGTNEFPVVNLTSPATNTVFLTMIGTNVGMLLEATATDDGDTNALTYTWTNLTRLDAYSFEYTNAASTAVNFYTNGVYVLQLTADDGQLRTRRNVTVVVNADATLAPDLLYWTLNDGTGTSALDTSGSGRDGMVVGTTNWVTNGVANGALGFGGTNAFVTEATNSHFLTGLKAFTLSLWIKSDTTNSDRGFISADDSGGTNKTFGLRSKTYDARSHGTNVIEATIPGKKGTSRYVSASNVTTNEWQHLALTWTNGAPPALFINGRQDTPTFPPLVGAGFLTNCLQFIAGRGPADGSNSWNGLLDDIRVYSRPLHTGEVAILAAMPPANLASVLDAGPDLTVQINLPVEIDATAGDDAKPNPPGVLSNLWTVVTTNAVEFTDPNSLTNTFVFRTLGTNILRLISDDGQVKVFDDVIVNVTEPTSIYLYASDPDAAEFGPDEGQFTIQRFGDTSFPLNIYLEYGGIASNGVDCVLLTNVVTIPTDSDTVTLTVRPFLDDRTEGDEPLIANVVSNVAYTIVSGQAAVIIHDSPYGTWTIAHFSLEELTFPLQSGALADFDHDGLINIGEYALNRDPKAGETNAPFATAIEVDSRDGQPHITFTYQRRYQPVDVLYGVFVSNDLYSWNTGTNYVEELQLTDDGNGLTETVKGQMVTPYSTSTNHFINLRIWQPQQ